MKGQKETEKEKRWRGSGQTEGREKKDRMEIEMKREKRYTKGRREKEERGVVWMGAKDTGRSHSLGLHTVIEHQISLHLFREYSK